MWSKIYLALLGLSLAAMAFFTYYSWSWLHSIGVPSVSVIGYEYHSGLAWTTLWITTAVLLLIGNAVLWSTNRTWAMWITFVYFAAVTVMRLFWLDEAYFFFKKTNNLSEGSFSVGPFFAVILIALMAAIVFFNQFLVSRMYQKMYPPAPTPQTEDVLPVIE